MCDNWQHFCLDQLDDGGVNEVKSKGTGVAQAGDDLLHLVWMNTSKTEEHWLPIIIYLKLAGGSDKGLGKFLLIFSIFSIKYSFWQFAIS